MVRKKVKKWKRILRRIITTLVVLVLLGVGGLFGWTKLNAEMTVTYDNYTASVGSISNSMSFSGSFSLIDNATYSAGSSGTVRTLYVSEGDSVQEGDKLIRLSTGEIVEAEFTGIVNTLSVEEGDEVTAGTSLVQVADFNHLSVSIRVDEYDISSVMVGQACTVTVTALETSFDTTIEHINYISASSGSVAYYTATATVDVSDGIYPGMAVTVTIPEEEATDVIILKMDALSFDADNKAFVYLMGDNETLYEQYVEVGINNGNYVEIKSGLSEGETAYVEVEETESAASGLAGLLSALGIGQQNDFRSNRDAMSGAGFDISTMGSGDFPMPGGTTDGTTTNGGGMPSFGGTSQ